MKLMFALLLAFAVASPAAAQHEVSQAELRGGKVRDAIDAIKRKDSPAALAILDPLLAEYDAEHRSTRAVIYCTTDMGDTAVKRLNAVADGKEAVTIDSTWCYALWAKGFALGELGRHAEAVAPLERATAMMPGNAHFLSELGYVHQALKDWDKALATYTAAAKVGEAMTDPAGRKRELRRAWFGMAYSLVELNRLDDAEDILRKCHALVPEDAKVLSELNFVLDKLGKPRVR
jgi:Flp pilus assembly protein TadD